MKERRERGAAGRRNTSPQQCCPSVFCPAAKRITDIMNQPQLKRGRHRAREREMREGERKTNRNETIIYFPMHK